MSYSRHVRDIGTYRQSVLAHLYCGYCSWHSANARDVKKPDKLSGFLFGWDISYLDAYRLFSLMNAQDDRATACTFVVPLTSCGTFGEFASGMLRADISAVERRSRQRQTVCLCASGSGLARLVSRGCTGSLPVAR